MNELGYYSLFVAQIFVVYIIVSILWGIVNKDGRFIRSAEYAVYAIALLVTVASAGLIRAFIVHDFSIKYVYEYSDKSMSLIYLVSAFWGGQEGSLLFWTWLLTLFFAGVIYQNRFRNRALMPYVYLTLAFVLMFFLSINNFATNPFRGLPFTPEDGLGLNPLLQNPGMFFHPLTLYIGYVGFTVPFAFAIAALVTKQLGDTWIITTRRWTIFAWFFLTLGNLFGAQWAYVELGWGGHWGWDPVENSSLMPWLTGTAYLHSVMIQERRGMLKIWNLFLIVVTFLLTIFGTFITRSGIIESVHSFGVSFLGPYFFYFMGFIAVVSLWLIGARLKYLKSRHALESVLSRESTFLFNNLILVGMVFTVLWGTVFPMISEAVTGVKVTVGPPFFNTVIVPLGLALILLTGICPLISWRRATPENFRMNFFYPMAWSLGVGALLYFAGVRHLIALLAYVLLTFVVASIVSEMAKSARSAQEKSRIGILRAFFRLFIANPRRYGGYVIHLGIVLMILANTGTPFKVEKQVTLAKGEETSVRNYEVRLDNVSATPTRNKDVVYASLSLFNGGEPLGKMRAEKWHFHKSDQPTTEVSIRSTLKEDFYVILLGTDLEKQIASFKFIINPLMVWLWIGGFVVGIGTLIAMLPNDRERRFLRGGQAG